MSSPKKGFLLLSLVCLHLFSFLLVSNAASLKSVSVDTESYKGNPWKIFHYDIDVDPGTGSSNVKANIRFIDFHGKSEVSFDEYWDSSQKTFPERKYVGYLDTVEGGGLGESHEGIMGCESVLIEGNAYLDSYDRSIDEYPQSISSEIKIFSNNSILTKGNSEIHGSLYGHEITVQENSYIEGDQIITQESWNCLKTEVQEVKQLVMTTNDNDKVVVHGSSNFDPLTGQLDLYLSQTDHVFLTEGVYYFTSLVMSGNSYIDIEGNVIIFCLSDITIDGNAEINIAGNTKNLSINSFEGSIELSGHSKVWGELFAPMRTVSLSGYSEVFGRTVSNVLLLSGNSLFHFNLEEMEQYLRLSEINVYDDQESNIGTDLIPTLTKGLEIVQWKIELGADGHYHKHHWVNNHWEEVGRIYLQGYSDYQMIFDARIMHELILVHGDNNICRRILGYEEFGQLRKLNFHRAWAVSWSVQEDPATPWLEHRNFPWPIWAGPPRYAIADEPAGTLVEFCRKLRMETIVTCSGYNRTDPNVSLCYWNRWKRLLDDAMSWGAVVEIDFFDNAIMKMDTNWNNGSNTVWGIHERIDKGGWKESPWNPSNQVTPNNLDPIESPETEYECDIQDSVYDLLGTNYFYFTAGTYPGVSLPILKNQQKMLVQAIVGYCKPWKNIMYQAINEPKYHDNYGNECLEWHKMVVGWIDDVIGTSFYKPQFGVNVFRYDQTSENTLIALVNGINNAPYDIKVSAVSYHACDEWWLVSNPPCANDIYDVIYWHRHTPPLDNKVCIIDTDGTPSCREDNDRLELWANIVHNNGEDFNHKDMLWIYYDQYENWINIFAVDNEAMRRIYRSFN